MKGVPDPFQHLLWSLHELNSGRICKIQLINTNKACVQLPSAIWIKVFSMMTNYQLYIFQYSVCQSNRSNFIWQQSPWSIWLDTHHVPSGKTAIQYHIIWHKSSNEIPFGVIITNSLLLWILSSPFGMKTIMSHLVWQMTIPICYGNYHVHFGMSNIKSFLAWQQSSAF